MNHRPETGDGPSNRPPFALLNGGLKGHRPDRQAAGTSRGRPNGRTPIPEAIRSAHCVAEGKTKKIQQIAGRPDLVALVAKDDITAGDGAKHDIIPDKGRLANATTCNVFRLLKACGLPVAFEQQDSATSFIAPGCTMLPYEVVVRREAHGSYLKRTPHFEKGQLFPKLIVEFFLKTKDKNWKGKPLLADDPLMLHKDGASQIELYVPSKPIQGQQPFLTLATSEVFTRADEAKLYPEMSRLARRRSWCWRRHGSSKAAGWSTSRSSSASTPRATCCSPT